MAAMYLGVSAAELDQNQITDYLKRVVQPRLAAIGGVQRADILGDRTFAMRIWLKPDRMAAHGISPSAVQDALARNNYLSACGSMVRPRHSWASGAAHRERTRRDSKSARGGARAAGSNAGRNENRGRL
jgi:multidrug efflux pump subunit AcrB